MLSSACTFSYAIHKLNNLCSYLTVYSLMLVVALTAYIVGYVFFVYGALRASRSIHKGLVKSVLGTTLRWLDQTPTSRIITRCTQDIQAGLYILLRILL